MRDEEAIQPMNLLFLNPESSLWTADSKTPDFRFLFPEME
jgi:hypothetical protein